METLELSTNGLESNNTCPSIKLTNNRHELLILYRVIDYGKSGNNNEDSKGLTW